MLALAYKTQKSYLYSLQAGKFSIIQLIIYIGSTLSYYALVSNH